MTAPAEVVFWAAEAAKDEAYGSGLSKGGMGCWGMSSGARW